MNCPEGDINNVTTGLVTLKSQVAWHGSIDVVRLLTWVAGVQWKMNGEKSCHGPVGSQ